MSVAIILLPRFVFCRPMLIFLFFAAKMKDETFIDFLMKLFSCSCAHGIILYAP